MKVTTDVCDVCRELGRPIKTYDIGEGERAVKRDLCEEHGAPLEALLADEPVAAEVNEEPASRQRGAAPGAHRARRAVTKKAATKKTAAKKVAAKKAAPARRAGLTVTTLEEIEQSKTQNQP